MGGFFTNVQVHIGNAPQAEVTSQVTGAIREWAAEDGLDRVDTPGAEADRTVLILPAPESPWISVYDEFTESQDLALLEDLSRRLSIATKGYALAILVHDSDVLELRLFRAGQAIDAYSSDPDYFGKVGRKRRAELRGHPEAWSDLLRNGATPSNLRDCLREKATFAEENLERIAGLLSLPQKQCTVGFNAISGSSSHGQSTVRLEFRSCPSPDISASTATGAPVLKRESHFGDRISCSVGDEFDDDSGLYVSCWNSGGQGKGLVIRVAGEAVEQSLFVPEVANVWKNPEPSAIITLPMVQKEDQDGRPVFEAEVQDFEIPAGHPMPAAPWEEGFGKGQTHWAQGTKALVAQMELRTTISVRVTGRATAQGEARLIVYVAPSDLRNAIGIPTMLEVFPPPRRPLRCEGRSRRVSEYLRMMENPAILTALVVLGAQDERPVALVQDAIARWSRVISPSLSGTYDVVVRMGKVKSFRVKAKDIPLGPDWSKVKDLIAAAADVAGYHDSKRWRERGLQAPPGPGFEFSCDPLFYQGPSADVLPHVALWANMEERPHASVVEATETLTEIVDSLMAGGRGVQAFAARWGTYAQPSHTVYELACDTDQVCTAGRAWCTRYLRAASERIWLGPELLARLGDPSELHRLAEVTPVGACSRIVLREGRSLGDLERILAPILPSRTDWKAEADRIWSAKSKQQE